MKLFAALVVLLVPSIASADDAAMLEWRPRLDIEPAAFFLDGYSVHVGVQPPAMPRLLLSAGAYAFDVPELLITLSGEDADRWNARLGLGAGVFAEYFVGAHDDRGWIVGGQLGFQQYQVSDAAGASRFTSGLVLLRGGYEWHPWGGGGYIYPWAGAAVITKVAGDDGGYAPFPVVPYVTLDLGWRLDP